jgi:hypothetical protein
MSGKILLALAAALLALAGCTPATPASTLPLAQNQPALLFFFTDG